MKAAGCEVRHLTMQYNELVRCYKASDAAGYTDDALYDQMVAIVERVEEIPATSMEGALFQIECAIPELENIYCWDYKPWALKVALRRIEHLLKGTLPAFTKQRGRMERACDFAVGVGDYFERSLEK